MWVQCKFGEVLNVQHCRNFIPLSTEAAQPSACKDSFPQCSAFTEGLRFPEYGPHPEEEEPPFDALRAGLSSLLLSISHCPCGNPCGYSTGKETLGKYLFFRCLKAKLPTWKQPEQASLSEWKIIDLVSVTCATYADVWQPTAGRSSSLQPQGSQMLFLEPSWLW